MVGTGCGLILDSNPGCIAVEGVRVPGHFAPFPISKGIESMSGVLIKVTQAGLELRLGCWTPNSRAGVPSPQRSMQGVTVAEGRTLAAQLA